VRELPRGQTAHNSRIGHFCIKDFVSQTDPVKLRERLDSLESAIFERLKELDRSDDSNTEKVAIQEACRKLLQVKVEKFGFPSVNDKSA
jgi:hypothetical protein